MKAVNIEWGTNGNEALLARLPKERRIPDSITNEEDASKWLTDVTGFYVHGLKLVKD